MNCLISVTTTMEMTQDLSIGKHQPSWDRLIVKEFSQSRDLVCSRLYFSTHLPKNPDGIQN